MFDDPEPSSGGLVEQPDLQICTGDIRQLEHIIIHQHQPTAVAQATDVGGGIVAVRAALVDLRADLAS